ncbi:hypothetical protein NOU13_20240 [Rhodococcus erythropolis]|uniref:hypothetical protein n=1 Tax=Rhodococcus TaxID=1827 RepID=UPI0005ADC2CA|nr:MULTISPECIES: hypothetical protein [Rhodococcus]KIM17739.1 hypothetical protein QV65_02545 [Rhodococcus erythropolis]MBO8148898.1 hypothetical protein [Rhodococcus erythropolis]MCQ4126835.1 hypothetical protein [Rhodococcus erythropolis]MDO1491119.1 hypothetical protein [Rhodococcus erythropolis]
MNRVTKMPPQLCGATSVANTHECQVRRAKRSRNRGSYADDLVDFAILWRPWNGATAEDIFVTFGLSPRTYYNRLRSALSGPAGSDLCVGLKKELAHLGPA